MKKPTILFVLLLIIAACSDDSVIKKDLMPSPVDYQWSDGLNCKRPTNMSFCDAPPNNFSKDKYYCWGCNCSGVNSVAACNALGDCRYFADGCYPQTHVACDKNAPLNISGLCDHCFFYDGGVQPADCDKQGDAGSSSPVDAGSSSPVDAGAIQ